MTGHRAASMSGMFAQEVIDTVTIPQMLDWWHAAVVLAAPWVLGLITNDAVKKSTKKALPVITAVGAGILTRFLNTDAGAEVLIIVPILATAVHWAHRGYGAIVSLLKRDDLSLNDILVPAKGIMDLLGR